MTTMFDWEARTALTADLPRKGRLDREDAQRASQTIQGYIDFAPEMIQKAQERQVTQANKKRCLPDFGENDFVYIIKRSERPIGRAPSWITFVTHSFQDPEGP